MTNLLARGQFKFRYLLFIKGIVGLFLAYLLGSRAIDTGSYWEYLGCLVFLGLSVKLFIRAVKN